MYAELIPEVHFRAEESSRWGWFGADSLTHDAGLQDLTPKFSKPLNVNGKEVAVLKIREPLAADLISMPDDMPRNAQMLRLIELCSDHAPGDLAGMSGKDFFAACEVVNDFFGVSRDGVMAMIANLASVWHWQAAEMKAMPVRELARWHALMLERQ